MTLPRKPFCPIHTFVELSKCSCAAAESARSEGKERAWLYERIESLTSENTRLRALLEEIPWDEMRSFYECWKDSPGDALGIRYVESLLAIKEKIE